MTASSHTPDTAPALGDFALTASAAARSLPTTTIAPAGRWTPVDVRELWAYRGLLVFLVWRDIKVRYAQTALGAAWAVLQPLLSMFVFTVIFGTFAKVPSDGLPYAAFALAALVPWTYFSTAFAAATNSLVQNTNLITKVYFPRLVIPFSSVIAGLLDLAIAFVLLLVVMAFYRIVPAPAALVGVPVLVVVMVLTTAGVGCWLSALNIKYRDVKYVTPFLIQVLQYALPIVYPLSLVPQRYRWFYALNPMVAVIEGFRSLLLRSGPLDWALVARAGAIATAVFVGGVLYFRRTERLFADVA